MLLNLHLNALDWQADKHPAINYNVSPQVARNRLKSFLKLDDHTLREKYTKSKRGGHYFFAEDFRSALLAAFGLWQSSGSEADRQFALRLAMIMLGDKLNSPIDQLYSKIDTRGAKNPQVFVMRDACFEFAVLYALTKDRTYAEKAAAILAKFAKVIPQWPIYYPHYSEARWSRSSAQTGSKRYTGWDATGLWGSWHYLDLHSAEPLLQAYDLIYSSKVMQENGTLEAIRRMLERHVEMRFDFPCSLGNMDGTMMQKIILFAYVLKQPEWIHRVVRRLKNLYDLMFYSDGWWHERTVSYHLQIVNNLNTVLKMLNGYSDPPGFVSKIDGTHFNKLDLSSKWAARLAQINAAADKFQHPNRTYHTINDTTYPQRTHQPPLACGKSALAGVMNYGMLADGAVNKDIIQVALTWGGTHGHEHYDCLNLLLFAFDHELLAETKYRPRNVTNTTREWHSMTAGHITVAVNEADQPGRLSADSFKRVKQPEDENPGVPDYAYRWYGHGNNLNDGFLELFDSTDPNLKIISADAPRAYGKKIKLQRYSRTIALVKTAETDYYVVDIFRVVGGKVHDYMLHSDLNTPYRAVFDFDGFKPENGVLYKYIKNLQSFKTSQAWSVNFKLQGSSVGIKSFFAPQANTEIIAGKAPAMRINGVAPFIAVRNVGLRSLYVAVHQPYRGKASVRKIDLLPLVKPHDQGVALKITLDGGREDVILSSVSDHAELQTADHNYSLHGRLGMELGGRAGQLYLAGGTGFKTPSGQISRRAIFTGRIVRTLEKGFVTDAELPADGSLNDRVIMVNLCNVIVQSFTIEKIERRGDATLIYLKDPPAMRISPGLIKLFNYPSWGITGDAKFRIAPLVRKTLLKN